MKDPGKLELIDRLMKELADSNTVAFKEDNSDKNYREKMME